MEKNNKLLIGLIIGYIIIILGGFMRLGKYDNNGIVLILGCLISLVISIYVLYTIFKTNVKYKYIWLLSFIPFSSLVAIIFLLKNRNIKRTENYIHS